MRLGLVVLSATLSTAFYWTGPTMAVESGGIGIRPATGSDFFHITLFPGSAIDATAIVSNSTAMPATLLTYPVDALTTPQGGFALASQAEVRQGVGAWVNFSKREIIVSARSNVEIPFRLAVPAGTPPGEYAGGLVIQSPVTQGQTSSGGDTAFRLDTIQRMGVRIYLSVAGTAKNSLSYGDLSWQRSSGVLTFSLSVRNTGNTIQQPSGSLELNSFLGSDSKLKFERIESLLPGAAMIMRAHQSDAPIVQAGKARAFITAKAGTHYADVKVFYAPWLFLPIALALLGAIFYLTRRLLRWAVRARRRRIFAAGSK